MLKYLNLTAIIALIGSAVWAYSVKYDTVFHVERVRKLEAELDRQKDVLSVMKAEWQLLNAPARLQILADRHVAGLRPATSRQVVRAIEVPEKAASGNPLEELITGSIPTPDAARRTTGRTPGR